MGSSNSTERQHTTGQAVSGDAGAVPAVSASDDAQHGRESNNVGTSGGNKSDNTPPMTQQQQQTTTRQHPRHSFSQQGGNPPATSSSQHPDDKKPKFLGGETAGARASGKAAYAKRRNSSLNMNSRNRSAEETNPMDGRSNSGESVPSLGEDGDDDDDDDAPAVVSKRRGHGRVGGPGDVKDAPFDLMNSNLDVDMLRALPTPNSSSVDQRKLAVHGGGLHASAPPQQRYAVDDDDDKANDFDYSHNPQHHDRRPSTKQQQQQQHHHQSPGGTSQQHHHHHHHGTRRKDSDDSVTTDAIDFFADLANQSKESSEAGATTATPTTMRDIRNMSLNLRVLLRNVNRELTDEEARALSELFDVLPHDLLTTGETQRMHERVMDMWETATRSPEFVPAFDAEFERLSANVQGALFASTDLRQQARALVGMITQAMRKLTDRNGLQSLLQCLGAKHGMYGVDQKYFGFMRSALNRALKASLRSKFTAELAHEWTTVYTMMANEMLTANKEFTRNQQTAASFRKKAAQNYLTNFSRHVKNVAVNYRKRLQHRTAGGADSDGGKGGGDDHHKTTTATAAATAAEGKDDIADHQVLCELWLKRCEPLEDEFPPLMLGELEGSSAVTEFSTSAVQALFRFLVDSVEDALRLADPEVLTQGAAAIAPAILLWIRAGYGHMPDWKITQLACSGFSAVFQHATSQSDSDPNVKWVENHLARGLNDGLIQVQAVFPFIPIATSLACCHIDIEQRAHLTRRNPEKMSVAIEEVHRIVTMCANTCQCQAQRVSEGETIVYGSYMLQMLAFAIMLHQQIQRLPTLQPLDVRGIAYRGRGTTSFRLDVPRVSTGLHWCRGASVIAGNALSSPFAFVGKAVTQVSRVGKRTAGGQILLSKMAHTQLMLERDAGNALAQPMCLSEIQVEMVPIDWDSIEIKPENVPSGEGGTGDGGSGVAPAPHNSTSSSGGAGAGGRAPNPHLVVVPATIGDSSGRGGGAARTGSASVRISVEDDDDDDDTPEGTGKMSHSGEDAITEEMYSVVMSEFSDREFDAVAFAAAASSAAGASSSGSSVVDRHRGVGIGSTSSLHRMMNTSGASVVSLHAGSRTL